MTLAELIELKESVDAVYGDGTFDTVAGDDIASITSLVRKQMEAKSDEHKLKAKSFKDAVVGGGTKEKIDLYTQHKTEGIPLKYLAMPRIEGGNIVVEANEGEYQQCVKELQYSIVGRVSLRKGEILHTTLELKKRLEASWGITNFKLIPLGKGP